MRSVTIRYLHRRAGTQTALARMGHFYHGHRLHRVRTTSFYSAAIRHTELCELPEYIVGRLRRDES